MSTWMDLSTKEDCEGDQADKGRFVDFQEEVCCQVERWLVLSQISGNYCGTGRKER